MNHLTNIPESDCECPICLSDIQETAKFDCLHVFCKDCLLQHLEYSSRCPICRKTATKYTTYTTYHCDYITHNIITEPQGGVEPVEDPYDQYIRENSEIECYLHANQPLYYSVIFSACITTLFCVYYTMTLVKIFIYA
jgi:hypothetical protein